MLFRLQLIYRRCFTSTLIHVNTQQIRQFNEKRSEKIINLEDRRVDDQILSTTTIIKSLQTCIEQKNLEQGIDIYQRLPSEFINNSSIQMHLIRLYST